MSTTEANEQLASDYFQAFLRRDGAWWHEHVALDFRHNDPDLPFDVIGAGGVKQLADALHPGIPDMAPPIEDGIAQGETVLVCLRVEGAHAGELMGWRQPEARSISVCSTCSRVATASWSSTGRCSTISDCSARAASRRSGAGSATMPET